MMSKARLLEVNMIKHEDWTSAPADARRLAEEESAQGVPTGIAQHPFTHRWFVIQSSGQGPYIIWEEEGQCEQCKGQIDDLALGDWRSPREMGPDDLSMPALCTECLDEAAKHDYEQIH